MSLIPRLLRLARPWARSTKGGSRGQATAFSGAISPGGVASGICADFQVNFRTAFGKPQPVTDRTRATLSPIAPPNQSQARHRPSRRSARSIFGTDRTPLVGPPAGPCSGAAGTLLATGNASRTALRRPTGAAPRSVRSHHALLPTPSGNGHPTPWLNVPDTPTLGPVPHRYPLPVPRAARPPPGVSGPAGKKKWSPVPGRGVGARSRHHPPR